MAKSCASRSATDRLGTSCDRGRWLRISLVFSVVLISSCATSQPRRARTSTLTEVPPSGESNDSGGLPTLSIARVPASNEELVEARRHPKHLVQTGKATFYSDHGGQLTANGERYDPRSLTAAHRTLPMQTHVKVTNLRNGRSVVVRINDRGPYGKGRIIDVSLAAAKVLDMIDAGVVPARIEVVP